jgi:hypothetical protein
MRKRATFIKGSGCDRTLPCDIEMNLGMMRSMAEGHYSCTYECSLLTHWSRYSYGPAWCTFWEQAAWSRSSRSFNATGMLDLILGGNNSKRLLNGWVTCLLTEADIHLSRVFECLNLETIEPASVSSRTREEPIVMNELKTFSKTKKKIPSSLHETFVFWGGVQNSLWSEIQVTTTLQSL